MNVPIIFPWKLFILFFLLKKGIYIYIYIVNSTNFWNFLNSIKLGKKNFCYALAFNWLKKKILFVDTCVSMFFCFWQIYKLKINKVLKLEILIFYYINFFKKKCRGDVTYLWGCVLGGKRKMAHSCHIILWGLFLKSPYLDNWGSHMSTKKL